MTSCGAWPMAARDNQDARTFIDEPEDLGGERVMDVVETIDCRPALGSESQPPGEPQQSPLAADRPGSGINAHGS